jgi:SAM-dependent methyltransferase
MKTKGQSGSESRKPSPLNSSELKSITRDPESWKRLWLQAKERSPVNRRERRGKGAELERWNVRAAGYARHGESEGSQGRREQILTWLEQAGAFRPGCRVLDIGAGPGNFAIPMARKAAEVVAVEPAREMFRILEQRVESSGIKNIHILPKTWEEVNPGAEGWEGAFDLAFASMSPGVANPDMLEKMVCTSRAFCYLSGWSGDRWGPWGLAQRDLWPLIFDEELGDYPSDILYPFGLLYAQGYRPELRFVRSLIDLEMDVVEAAAGLVDHFNRYVEVGSSVREIITAYVHRNSRQGVFRQTATACQGFMLWPVGRD